MNWSCSPATSRQQVMPDDHSKVAPLLPIPNRTVKRLSANDSADSRVKVGHRQASTAKNAQSKDWAFFYGRYAFCPSQAIRLFVASHGT